jgi:hypothetical protein
MSAERDMTRIVRSWLQVDEHESADRVLDIVLDLLDTTPQHRSAWPVRRFVFMNSYAKLAIAAVVVVVVAIGGLALLRPGGSSAPGGAPTATPSPTPSPSAAPSGSTAASPSPISTTDWVPFTSDRYGYTISYPPTHTGMPGSTKSAPTFVGQAQRDFVFGTDRFEAEAGRVIGEPTIQKLESNALDWIVFGPDGYQIGFWGFAETIPAGTSVDDIISQNVGTEDPIGVPLPTCESEPTTIDGQPGRFDVCGDSVSIAVVIIDDRAYVFIQGRGSVTKDLMLAQLSTVQLPTP